MKTSIVIAVLVTIGLTAGPAFAKRVARDDSRTASTQTSDTQSYSCDSDGGLVSAQLSTASPSGSVSDCSASDSGLVSDLISPADPGRVYATADSCADFSWNELFLEHEVSLQYYSGDTGEPTDHFFDLVFHVCRPLDDPALTQYERQHMTSRLSAAIDHFIDVLQHHFETRGMDYFSDLTQCFDENGLTYRAPIAASEVSPDDPSIPYLPIIGYQLLFAKDPVISIQLARDLGGALGRASLGSMPNDSYSDPGLNFIFLNSERISTRTPEAVAGTIAHEMGHLMGYSHDDPTDPETDTSMTYAIGNCIADYGF